MSRNYTVSIVIPTYNTWNLTNSLLSDLSSKESENIDEIIIVNDGGEGFMMIDDPHIRVLNLQNNEGFTIACNKGLGFVTRSFSPNHLIFLISNDVQIHGKFIQQTADIILSGRKYLIGNRLIDWDTGWNGFDGKVFNYLEGFFLAATSDGWRDLGFFDERYAPHDMEDVDLSTTAKSRGYKLVSLNNPNIVHKGAGTLGYNPEREAITLRNKELFREKWIRE